MTSDLSFVGKTTTVGSAAFKPSLYSLNLLLNLILLKMLRLYHINPISTFHGVGSTIVTPIDQVHSLMDERFVALVAGVRALQILLDLVSDCAFHDTIVRASSDYSMALSTPWCQLTPESLVRMISPMSR